MKFWLTIVHAGLFGCFEFEKRAEGEGTFLISSLLIYLFEKKGLNKEGWEGAQKTC